MSKFCGVISTNPPKHPRDEYIDWNDLEIIVDYSINETKGLCSVYHRQTLEFTDREKLIVNNVLQLENCNNVLCHIFKLHAQTEQEMENLTSEINIIQECVSCLVSKPNEIFGSSQCRNQNEHDRLYNNLINLSTRMAHLEANIEIMNSETPKQPELVAFFYNINKYIMLTLEALENTEKNIYMMQSRTENIENLLKKIDNTHCMTVGT